MTDTPKLITIDVAADKYRYIMQADGTVTCYRNGQVWFEGNNINRGNNMLMSIAGRLHEAEEILRELILDPGGIDEVDDKLLDRIETFVKPNPHYPGR